MNDPPPARAGRPDKSHQTTAHHGTTTPPESAAPRSVLRSELYGANIPDWVIDAARARHVGWMVKRPGEAARVGLIWEWVLDNSGLPAGYRWALHVIAHLVQDPKHKTWTMATVAERTGVDESTLRKTWVPNLEAWGWLRLVRPPQGTNNVGTAWTVTVPVDQPPNRVATGNRSPGEPPGENAESGQGFTGRTARSHRVNRPVTPGEPPGDHRVNRPVRGQWGAKGASGGNPRAAASRRGAEISTPTRTNDSEFWAAIGLIEEHKTMPAMTKRERHRLARFLARKIGNDTERIGLMLDHLAAIGAPPGDLVDAAGADLGMNADEIRRLADGARS